MTISELSDSLIEFMEKYPHTKDFEILCDEGARVFELWGPSLCIIDDGVPVLPGERYTPRGSNIPIYEAEELQFEDCDTIIL